MGDACKSGDRKWLSIVPEVALSTVAIERYECLFLEIHTPGGALSDKEKLEKVILPTEFQNLKDFQTFLKIANYGITRMATPKTFLPCNLGLAQMLRETCELSAPIRAAEIPQFAP